jgi:geranylgeranyl pyrophosphate synthase
MWQKKQAELVRKEIEALLASLSDVAGLHDLVEELLSRRMRGTAAESGRGRLWSLLPLIVCEAISGRYEHAVPAAASLGLFVAAGDVFDDIEDADSSESLLARYGSAVATNVATTLLILAERAITRLEAGGVEPHIVVRVMDVINSFYTTACAGQHLDLSLAPEAAVSEDMYLRIAAMKSASTGECACHIGALLATANQGLIDTLSRFGHNLGMATQINNDIQGIIQGTDIVHRKLTLPVVYALAQTDGEAHDRLCAAFSKQAEYSPDPNETRDLLFRAGAIHYATVKMELYKQQALDILSEAERAGANVERLKLFLE